jgi:phosphonate transport system permease protein
VSVGPAAPAQVWHRWSPRQTALRWAGQALLAALTAVMLWHVGVRWEYLSDAPAQMGDLFSRMLPPEWSFAHALWRPLAQTINIATLGTVAAIVLAVPVAYCAALNTSPSRVTYALARVVIVVTRSVDTLIWALVFIIVVGPGPLAGALAVAMRSIGFLAKLFAEAVEEIDTGQVEAVAATGAGRLQTLLYGIVPQVKPIAVGVSIYRWDINIRESTVLGLVGAGGIGFTLNEAILGLEWARVGLIILVILAVVLVSEAVSAYARARIT